MACAETALHRGAVLLELPADKGRAVIFENELVAGHGGSAEHRAGAKRNAAQEFVGRHRLLAGALDLGEAHGALAAGNGQMIVEHRAGRARDLRQASSEAP